MQGTETLEELVEANMGLIIRTVSGVTGRYVSVEQDDAFSIALIAFAEAVERFDETRGGFAAFAGLVMRSRLLTYLRKASAGPETVSLDAMEEAGQSLPDRSGETGSGLSGEIGIYKEELAKFGLTLEILADQAPRHRDTRKRAVETAETASGEPDIVAHTYRARRLPIRQVARCCGVTEKIVKTSRTFILGAMLLFVKKLTGLMAWARGTR